MSVYSQVLKRIQRLEAMASQIESDLVTVTFLSGERVKVPPSDVIHMILEGTVSSVDGQVNKGNGMLLELLRGLLDEV